MECIYCRNIPIIPIRYRGDYNNLLNDSDILCLKCFYECWNKILIYCGDRECICYHNIELYEILNKVFEHLSQYQITVVNLISDNDYRNSVYIDIELLNSIRHTIGKYRCPYCDFLEIHNKNIIQHLYECKKIKNEICGDCGIIDTADGLIEHKKLIHNDGYQCENYNT